MNRRTLVIAISIAIAFCLGVYFYAQWDMKRFDASLPEPPAADTVKEIPAETAVEDISDAAQPAAETSAGHWHGDEWHEEPHTAAEPPAQPVRAEPQYFVYLAPHEITRDNFKAEMDKVRAEGETLSAEVKALVQASRENRLSTEEHARWATDWLQRSNANKERFEQLLETANQLYGGKNE